MEITYIGLCAGAITSLAAVPQLVRTYRTKHARDISIWQPVLLNVGMLLWLIYGIALNDIPLIATNVFSIICYTWLMVMKIRFRKDDNRPGGDYIVSDNNCREDI